MRAENRLIVSLNPASWLTLLGLCLSVSAFLILADVPSLSPGRSLSSADGSEPRFFLALGLMYLGMLADAFDGIAARKYGWESEFGRYLDGFADVFNYLVVPNLALWRLGFSGPLAGIVIVVMIAAGSLRLSKFNMIGNIKHEGTSKYLGLPVFWSQLLLFPLYLVFVFVPRPAFHVTAALVWPLMSFAFVYNRPFFKPKNPWIIAGLMTGLSTAGFALFLAGRHP